MKSYKLPMRIWVFCALAAGCAVDRGEMAAYKEHQNIWLQRNWKIPGSEPALVQESPPIPPKREVFPPCLSWVPFRIVHYVDQPPECEAEKERKDLNLDGQFVTAWNGQFVNPDAQREHARMGPMPPHYDSKSELKRPEKEEKRSDFLGQLLGVVQTSTRNSSHFRIEFE